MIQFVLLTTLTTASLAAQATSQVSADPRSRDLGELLRWEPRALPFVSAELDDVLLPLRMDGQECSLRLQRHSLRAPDVEVLVTGDEPRTLGPRDLPRAATYRGVVIGPDGGQRDAQVAAARGRDGRWTLFILGARALTLVQPLADFVPGASPRDHVLYDARDVGPSPSTCGNSSFPEAEDLLGTGRTRPDLDSGGGGSSGGARSDGGGLYQAELAFEADQKYYKLLGKDPVAVVEDIETVMNAIDLIYRRDVAISHEISFYLIRTKKGENYSKAKGLLNEMLAYWNANLPHVARDTAHLMTGHDHGGLIGQARISVVCKLDRAYGYSHSRWTTNFAGRVLLTAHELGHNWSGMHCDAQPECRVMCGTINGCDGGQTFVISSQDLIRDYRDSQSCFERTDREAELPFYDSFETGLVDHPAWSYQRGVQVVTGVGDEPNGAYCLELNSEGAGETREDVLRTGLLDLAGQTQVSLSFFSRSRSVPAGEQLRVDFYDQDRNWKPLYTVTSNGTDPSGFDFHRVSLDAVAWPELRLAFTVTDSDPAELWYLDDVQVRRGGLAHTISPLIAGQPAEFAARGAVPGNFVYFLYSLIGLGDGPCIAGECFDILPPLNMLGVRTADGAGDVFIRFTIPASTPPTDYYGQLAAIGSGGLVLSHAVPTRTR